MVWEDKFSFFTFEFRKNKKSYTHHTYYDGKHEKEMFDLEFNKVKTR